MSQGPPPLGSAPIRSSRLTQQQKKICHVCKYVVRPEDKCNNKIQIRKTSNNAVRQNKSNGSLLLSNPIKHMFLSKIGVTRLKKLVIIYSEEERLNSNSLGQSLVRFLSKNKNSDFHFHFHLKNINVSSPNHFFFKELTKTPKKNV